MRSTAIFRYKQHRLSLSSCDVTYVIMLNGCIYKPFKDELSSDLVIIGLYELIKDDVDCIIVAILFL